MFVKKSIRGSIAAASSQPPQEGVSEGSSVLSEAQNVCMRRDYRRVRRVWQHVSRRFRFFVPLLGGGVSQECPVLLSAQVPEPRTRRLADLGDRHYRARRDRPCDLTALREV